MVRTQIQLTEEQVAQLKELAHEGNESIAAIIRKALNEYLAKQQPNTIPFTARPCRSGKISSRGA